MTCQCGLDRLSHFTCHHLTSPVIFTVNIRFKTRAKRVSSRRAWIRDPWGAWFFPAGGLGVYGTKRRFQGPNNEMNISPAKMVIEAVNVIV